MAASFAVVCSRLRRAGWSRSSDRRRSADCTTRRRSCRCRSAAQAIFLAVMRPGRMTRARSPVRRRRVDIRDSVRMTITGAQVAISQMQRRFAGALGEQNRAREPPIGGIITFRGLVTLQRFVGEDGHESQAAALTVTACLPRHRSGLESQQRVSARPSVGSKIMAHKKMANRRATLWRIGCRRPILAIVCASLRTSREF